MQSLCCLSEFPLELLDLILIFIQSPQDFASLALVSRFLRYVVERHLYSNIVLYDKKSCDVFPRALLNRPERCDLVRHYTYKFPYQSQGNEFEECFMLEHLKKMNNLEHLTLDLPTWDPAVGAFHQSYPRERAAIGAFFNCSQAMITESPTRPALKHCELKFGSSYPNAPWDFTMCDRAFLHRSLQSLRITNAWVDGNLSDAKINSGTLSALEHVVFEDCIINTACIEHLFQFPAELRSVSFYNAKILSVRRSDLPLPRVTWSRVIASLYRQRHSLEWLVLNELEQPVSTSSPDFSDFTALSHLSLDVNIDINRLPKKLQLLQLRIFFVPKLDGVAILRESPNVVKEKLPMLTDIVLDLRGPTVYAKASIAVAHWAEVGVKLRVRNVKSVWSVPPKMGEIEGSHPTTESSTKLCQLGLTCSLTAQSRNYALPWDSR